MAPTPRPVPSGAHPPVHPGVPVALPADAPSLTAWAATARWPARRSLALHRLPRALAARRPALRAALHACGLDPAAAAAELRAADRLTLRCLAAACRRFPRAAPARAAVVVSYADPVRPLLSLLEGVLPALLGGTAVTTVVAPGAVPTAGRLARAMRDAGVPEGLWSPVTAPDGRLAALHAALAEHACCLAPQCCPPPFRPRPPGLLVVRHDGDARRAARALVRGLAAGTGRTCAATPLVAVHATRWDEFTAALPRETGDGAGSGGRAAPVALTHAPVAALAAAARRHGHGAVAAPFTAWAEVLHAARGAGVHAAVFTRTPWARVAPQFDALPPERPALNALPRPGPTPVAALRLLRSRADRFRG
ncbi:hypothetical protein [Streptomyces sp. TR02-1]|uniref:hypothetical protein n=1 Tax=Streptomyces sp. TR02-1 TaxID=3385977 RepID=UPI0039A08D1C